MNIELISYFLCGFIPLVYLIIYVIKENKKSTKKRNYLYGLIITIVLALILFVIKLLVFNVILTDKKEDNNMTTTTTTTELTSGTTTEKTTEKTTTSKKASTGSYNYNNILTPEGGTVIGKTSKGYEIKKVDDLYYVGGYLIANKTFDLPNNYDPKKLNATVNEAANKMFAAAKAEKGFNMRAQSGYRSYDTQKKLYDRYASRDGKAKADTYSARPGYSEHQTGLAFDVCDSGLDNSKCITSGFDNTAQAKWLSENAYKYGFILRYPKGDDKVKQTGYMYESWHFRYVGTELAEKLYNNGDWITMEDYFGITSSYDTKPVGA